MAPKILRGFKEMSDYLVLHEGMSVHYDTLRKAVSDDRNPLPVTWDAGRALISPANLLLWRERRIGLRRRDRRAA